MLTKENKKVLKEMLDNWIDLSGWKEMLSDVAINIGVDQIDKQLLDRYVKPESEELVNRIFDFVQGGQYDEAVAAVEDVMDDMVDLPWFDEPAEELLFEGLFKILQAIILQIQTNASKTP